MELSDTTITLKVQYNSNSSIQIISNTIQGFFLIIMFFHLNNIANQWCFLLIYYRPSTMITTGFSEGILNFQLSTFSSENQYSAVYLPKTPNNTASNKIILLGCPNSFVVVLFKQLKVYKGSLLNAMTSVPDGCAVWIGNPTFYFLEVVWNYGYFYECLLPKQNFMYKEYTSTFNTSSNLVSFCNNQSKSRLSISGQEIFRCETCYNGICPESGICQDGVVQTTYEYCDDGKNGSASVCSHYCETPKPGYKCNTLPNKTSNCTSICGDGIWIKTLEECDDGNRNNGDGCSVNCSVEPGFACKDDAVQRTLSYCYRCANYCNKCVKETCVGCQNGFFLYNGKCLDKCPKGMKPNNISGVCVDCSISNCSNCKNDVNGSEMCLQCNNSLFLINGTSCNSSCPNFNYYIDGTNCYHCPPNCVQCSKDTLLNQIVCKGCMAGFYLSSSVCVDHCNQGQFIYGGQCSSCVQNCSSCDNAYECSVCQTGFVLSLQQQCASKCEPHQYNSTGVCKECNTECLECSFLSSNCSGCASGYLPDKTNLYHCLALECPKYCDKCQTSVDCQECMSDYVLQDNVCQPICQTTGVYLNETEQKCLQCSDNCVTCNSSTFCQLCRTNYVLFNNSCFQNCGYGYFFNNTNLSCQACNLIPGLNLDCTEKCGDGIRYSLDPNACDDNNVINGDGCSSSCQIEPNYVCKRLNSTNPDKCYDIRPLDCSIYIYQDNPQIVFVTFSKNFYIDKPFNLSNSFIVNISGIHPVLYPYNVVKYSDNSILFDLEYKTSFQNATLTIYFKNATAFHDINNISFLQSNVSLSGSLPRFIYLDQETKKTINDMADKTQTAGIATVSFSAAPLALIQAMNVFWCLIDAMQIANFYLLLNIDYPQNAAMFFDILSASNLKFLPNYFEKIFNLNFTIQQVNGVPMQVDPVIQAPNRFSQRGMTLSFIKNAGGISGMMFIVLFIFMLLSMSVKIFERRKAKGKLVEYITKFYRLIRYDLILRMQLTIFLDLTLATLLQLRVCSAKEKTYLYGFVMSVVCLCYLFYFFYIVLKIVNDPKVISKDKAYFEVYGTLYEGLNVARTIPRNYQPIMIIRKFIFCIILVYSHDYPFVAVSLIGFIQIVSAVILVKFKPFVTNTQNIVAIFSEIFLSVVMVMVLSINILNEDNSTSLINDDLVSNELKLGWALIAFCLSVLALYLLLFGYTQYVNYKKAKEILVGVQKTARDTLHRFKTRIMEGSWHRDQRTNSKGSIGANTNSADSSLRDKPRSISNSDSQDISPSRRTKFSKFKKPIPDEEEKDGAQKMEDEL